MIIDLILDRKDGIPYNPYDFYTSVMKYEEDIAPTYPISTALDSGTEEEVKKAICHYIIDYDYPPAICDYINSKQWTV